MRQLYVNVNESGEIVKSYFGENVIPSEPFDFYFLVENEVAENVHDYMVVIEELKPTLVLKEVENE